jgi:hypothetical protein
MSNVRFSIAPLVRFVVVDGVRHRVSIWLDKRKRYGALGGASAFTEAGRDFLIGRYGAVLEGEGVSALDARFSVPAACEWGVGNFFKAPDSYFFEVDPKREIAEELATVELEGQSVPILSVDEAQSITFKFLEVSFQPKERLDQQRIFYFYEMHVSLEIWMKMIASEYIRELTEEEVATTKGGAEVGISREGFPIANNIY